MAEESSDCDKSAYQIKLLVDDQEGLGSIYTKGSRSKISRDRGSPGMSDVQEQFASGHGPAEFFDVGDSGTVSRDSRAREDKKRNTLDRRWTKDESMLKSPTPSFLRP
jgi:hypothetical protein